jgi:hypothetical protein
MFTGVLNKQVSFKIYHVLEWRRPVGESQRQLDTMIGIATVGSMVTGVVGVVAALISFFNGDLAAGGACLIAAALSFGLLANALLRAM